MKHILLLFGLVMILSSYLVSAVCTVDINDFYVNGDLITIRGTCDNKDEETRSYTFTYTNGSDTIDTDTGTTPKKNIDFFQTYLLPNNYVETYGYNFTVTLTGTNLEGEDYANVSIPTASDLLISDISITDYYYEEKEGGIRFKVTNAGNPVVNAKCFMDIISGDSQPLTEGFISVSQGDGYIITGELMESSFVKGGKEYLWDMACVCFDSDNTVSDGQVGHCYDGSTGLQIDNFASTVTQFPFTITDMADKIIVNKTVSEYANVTGIWVENEEGNRYNE